MIIKPLRKPLLLQKYEALLPRLGRNAAVEKEHMKYVRGFEGEKEVDYHLRQMDETFTILSDVYLNPPGVQMDYLVLTQRAIYIVEVKNFTGTITFDLTLDQLIRHQGGKETGFKNPLTQAERQKEQLHTWLESKSLKKIPIYYFIAISDPATVIKVNGDGESLAEIVTHGENLPRKLMEKERTIQTEYPIQHRKLGYEILRACKEFDLDMMKKHNLSSADLRRGVACPGCGRLEMLRIHSGWTCPRCNTKSKEAHSQALADYFLLVKPSITNAETRNWLKIQSRSTATRILQASGLIYNKTRSRWEKNASRMRRWNEG